MYKFIITLDLLPDCRDKILAQATAAQAATRAETGCVAYDFYACTDDANRLVFIETWVDQAAHESHMEQKHTKNFIAFHTQFHKSLTFEIVNIASA